MKLGIISDLHREFDKTTGGRFFEFAPKLDVFYINAGDTMSPASDVDRINKLYTDRCGVGYFYIYGNHDYYWGDFHYPEFGCKSTILDNGVKITGATLWTDLSSDYDWMMHKRLMSDPSLIAGMTQERYNEAHQYQKNFLLTSGADIIVSHHLPSFKSVHPAYTLSPVNHSFYTELEEDILNMEKPPKLWIHGHTHTRHDYMIGETRVICHPRGYPGETPWYNDYEPLIVNLKE